VFNFTIFIIIIISANSSVGISHSYLQVHRKSIEVNKAFKPNVSKVQTNCVSSVFFCTYVTELRNANVECLAISHLRVYSFREVHHRRDLMKLIVRIKSNGTEFEEISQFYTKKICNFINQIILLRMFCFSGVAELPIHNAVTTFNSIIDVLNVLH